MLQGFYWDSNRDDMGFGNTRWSTLNGQAGEISEFFTLVWLPPSGCSSGGVGYIPRQWSNQNCDWGNQSELKTLINNLHDGGCKVIADIVVNHRGGWSDWADFAKEDFGKYGTYQLTNQHICNSDEYSGQKGGNDDGENYGSARDLCHSDEYVQKTVIAYLKWMKDEMGYDGWRYDMVKGFHPWHVGHYNDESNPYISIGEFFDGSYDNLMWWVREAWGNSMVFDFAFKFTINDAFKSFDFTKLCWKAGNDNQPAGLIHHVDSRQYAVTFLDNHDTYARGNGNELCDSGDKNRILQASAFQLCAPGIPCVFYPHWQKYKAEIKPMIEARRSAEIHSNSNIDVNRCEGNLYVATIHGDNGRLIVKIGSGSYSPPNDFKLVTSGQDYAIWSCYTNAPSFSKPRVTASPESGSYLSSQKITLSSNTESVYYTIDGSQPSKNSIRYTSPITLPIGVTHLKAVAYANDSQPSKIVEYTYNIADQNSTDPITVRFKKPSGWQKVNLWAWDDNDNNLYGSEWPGKPMNDLGNGWWSYTFSKNIRKVNVLFNNGASTSTIQTGDMKNIFTSTGFIFNGEGQPCTISDEAFPGEQLKVNFSPMGGTYMTGQKLTLSASNSDADIYYTTDGSTPSKGAFLYNAPFVLPQGTITIKAIAYQGAEHSSVMTQNYNIVDQVQSTAITVQFKKPDSWQKVNLWAWDDNDNNLYGSEWPGKPMNDLGNGWWSYTFPENIKKVNVLFNNGVSGDSNIQTGDMKNITVSTGFVFNGEKQPCTICNDNLPGDGIKMTDATERAKVYPNPASNYIVVEKKDLSRIQLYSLVKGILMINKEVQNHDRIDISHLSPGLYVLKLININHQVEVCKVIKK
jgi:alpha-amylase